MGSIMSEIVVKKIASLTLATLMSLSQWYSDGVASLKKEDYKGAVAAFSRVIEEQVDENPLLETSLLMRSQGYAKLGEKKKAIADLETLLNGAPDGKLAALAAAEFKELSGKDWLGVDLSTPKKSWESFLSAMLRKDVKAVKRCCHGEMARELPQMLEMGPEQWIEVSAEISSMVFQSVTYNAASNKACVVLASPDETEEILMEKVEKKWLFSRDFDGRARREFDVKPAKLGKVIGQSWADDTNKLRQLDAAIEQYTLASGGRPVKLADASAYVKDFAATSVSAVDGKPFLFARGTDQRMWVFMATAVDGKRQGLMNGRIATVSDSEFRNMAKVAGLKIPVDWKKIAVSEDEAKEIRLLIGRLGGSTFKERRSAYKKLKQIGSKAGVYLEKAANNADPEIAMQAKKLLSEL
ncbi:MAG: hypothetical protein QGI24_02000 [Kiritimatiellia bacterium]|nr:hypothetical protein [Kiritimatiellia bacterium]MDP6847537.1 hypothetical protein [Kiritimatiellia bacterium]